MDDLCNRYKRITRCYLNLFRPKKQFSELLACFYKGFVKLHANDKKHKIVREQSPI